MLLRSTTTKHLEVTMSKPTAVQWLIKELKDLGYYTYNLEKLCEQAKQMEKEQIIDAYKSATIQLINKIK